MNRIIQAKYHSRVWYTVAVFLLFANVNLVRAQKLTLIDKTTWAPVESANYAYGDQQGVSSENGEIELDFVSGESLIISHIQYGKHRFASEEVDKALMLGELLLAPRSHNLQPVTFLSIHPKPGEREQLTFKVQDQLSHDAGQLLEQFSSISSIRKSGAYGFDPVLRGFKYDQINLVIDGTQCATAGCPNRMDPASSQVPLNIIEQAELMKGPHSLRYGNAFGGTINFKSAAPHFSNEVTVRGRLGSSFETNGEVSRNEALIGLSSRGADLSIFGSLASGKDYTDGAGIEIPSDFYRTNVGGKLGLKLSETQYLNLLLSNNYAKDVDFPALPMDLRKDDTWLINLGHEATFLKKALSSWSTTVYATWVDHLMDNRDKAMNPRTVNANTAAKTNNLGGRTEVRFDLQEDWLHAGADLRQENAEGTRQRDMLMGPMAGQTLTDNVWQDACIRKNGLFAEYHHQRAGYHLVFSGRLELNHAEVRDPDPNFASQYSKLSSDLLNPTLSLGGTRTLNEQFAIGLWMATAQRSGSLAERYINYFPIGLDPYELVGNPELKAETNNQIDLIFDYKQSGTVLSLNLFSSFLNHYISSEIREDLQARMASAPGVRQFVNINHARISGFEMSWQQQLNRQVQHIAELAYTHGQNTATDEALPEIPPMEFRYQLIGSFMKERLRAELNLRHAFEQNRIAQSYGETKTPAFTLADLKTSFTITKQLSTSAAVHNLLDEAYYEHLSRSVRSVESRPIYSPGRSFYLSLSYRFR